MSFEVRRDVPESRRSQRERDLDDYGAVIQEAWDLRKAHTGVQHIWTALNNYKIRDRATRIRIKKLAEQVHAEWKARELEHKRQVAEMDELKAEEFMRGAKEHEEMLKDQYDLHKRAA